MIVTFNLTNYLSVWTTVHLKWFTLGGLLLRSLMLSGSNTKNESDFMFCVQKHITASGNSFISRKTAKLGMNKLAAVFAFKGTFGHFGIDLHSFLPRIRWEFNITLMLVWEKAGWDRSKSNKNRKPDQWLPHHRDVAKQPGNITVKL